MEVALINEELFKANSPIKDDTAIEKFVPYILIVQAMYIKPLLGLPLYEELQTQIKAASVTPAPDTNPITPANQALLIEIAPALSFYAVYQGIPFHWASLVNKGVTILESENSKGVSVNDIAQLRRWLLDDATRLMGLLTAYLGGCGLYPLYKPADGCGCNGNANASNTSLNQGIYIPKRRKSCRY